MLDTKNVSSSKPKETVLHKIGGYWLTLNSESFQRLKRSSRTRLVLPLHLAQSHAGRYVSVEHMSQDGFRYDAPR